MASFFVIRGRDQGRRFELGWEVATVGRDGSNAIQLHDTEVSRRHAEIHSDQKQHELVDLLSSNGTYVNNHRIERHQLKNGDRVQIGRTLMIYTAPEESATCDAAKSVDIIGSGTGSQSRIVSTIGQEEGSRLFSGVEGSESPWLARARSNLQIMYRTALAVSHTLDIDQLLARIMELIFEWVEADRGCVMLMDPETDELRPAVRRDRMSQQPDAIAISRTILDYVLERNEGVLTSDARGDERWEAAGSIVSMGIREAICVPMQGRYGVVGVIYIDTFTPPGRFVLQPRTNKFTDDHLKLMVAIGHQAALAIEDTFYYSAMLQAERLAAIGQTIATLSHHIKNILQGIRGGSFLIEEGLKAGDSQVVRRGWAIVDKNQDRISNLVMDMLSFSKERDPEMIGSDIREVVGDVVELMTTRAADAQVALDWQPGEELPRLRFDPEAMHRAILNVVTNAIDACEKIDGGRVSVRTQLSPDRAFCEVVVQDNGEGILPEDRAKIFSVFESRKGSRGTGLGLPVSQKILREHGGNITLESAVGVGSTFTLAFPAVVDETGEQG